MVPPPILLKIFAQTLSPFVCYSRRMRPVKNSANVIKRYAYARSPLMTPMGHMPNITWKIMPISSCRANQPLSCVFSCQKTHYSRKICCLQSTLLQNIRNLAWSDPNQITPHGRPVIAFFLNILQNSFNFFFSNKKQSGVSIWLSQPLYIVVHRFWASDMFDDLLVGKGLAKHGILEKSEKE